MENGHFFVQNTYLLSFFLHFHLHHKIVTHWTVAFLETKQHMLLLCQVHFFLCCILHCTLHVPIKMSVLCVLSYYPSLSRRSSEVFHLVISSTVELFNRLPLFKK